MNFRHPSKTDIEINHKTKLEEQNEIPFKLEKFQRISAQQ